MHNLILKFFQQSYARRVFFLVLCLGGVGGFIACGTVGPIVAPQDIGVNAKRQKDLTEKERLQREAQARQERDGDRAVLPGRVPATVQPTAEEEPEAPSVPGKIVNPSARPTGDVFVMPR